MSFPSDINRCTRYGRQWARTGNASPFRLHRMLCSIRRVQKGKRTPRRTLNWGIYQKPAPE
jgi:hypothetical protein